jgi:hypothetical protein
VKNVKLSVSGNTLTITVDLTQEFGPSSSGKTIIIASTEGNFPLPGRTEVVGLNVYRKKKRRSRLLNHSARWEQLGSPDY